MPAVTGAIAFLGALFLPATAGFVLSLAVGATILGVVTVAAVRTLGLKDQGELGGSVGISSHQTVVRSTVEPMRIVYGEALVSGPIWYMNAAGGEYRSLYVAIALTGHECEALVGVWLDDKYVPAADIDLLGSSGDGSVDADTNSHGYGPVGGTPVLYLREHLGSSTQVTDTMLDSAFTDIGTNHRLRGRAYLVVRADKLEGADEVWQAGFPSNVAAVVQGMRVYDPRLDSTFTGSWGTGSGAHRVATPSTWEWSDNPALCLGHYLLDSSLGVGIAAARIDWNAVAVAADICDASVSIPGSTTEARFRANGVLLTSDTHRRNIEKLLSSFDGTLRFVGGLYQVITGSQTVAAALDESHLTGALRYQKQPTREARYNAIRGTYLDASRRHKESQYLTVSDATLASSRDSGLTIYKDLDLPMTSGEYTAQRLAIRAINKADLTGVVVFPTGYNGLALAVGDAITVTNDELGWSAKRFRVLGLRAVDLVGVEIMAQEDATTAYADPAVGDYGTRSAAGTIDFPNAITLPEGVVTDPQFTGPIERYWTVTAGAGVSISSGGGEGGGNALVLTNAASVVQAARTVGTFNTSPGEIISGQMRATRTADVSNVVVRTYYYRSDTLAQLGTQDQDVTAKMASAATYYTVSWRQATPTSYTLAAGVRIFAKHEIRMTPDGSGTATLTVSGFAATRLGVVGTDTLEPEAATIVAANTATSTITIPYDGSPATIQELLTVTFTATGGPVTIDATAFCQYAYTGAVSIKQGIFIVRGALSLANQVANPPAYLWSTPSASFNGVVALMRTDTPPAGSVTYRLCTISRANSADTFTVEERSLTCTEVKR